LAGGGGPGNISWPADCRLGRACGPGSLPVAQFIDIKREKERERERERERKRAGASWLSE